MLEEATVTVKYKEFRQLEEMSDKSKRLEKRCQELEKEIDKKLDDIDEIKVLDKTIDILMQVKNSKTAKQKQNIIDECIKYYCNTFDIPIEELRG